MVDEPGIVCEVEIAAASAVTGVKKMLQGALVQVVTNPEKMFMAVLFINMVVKLPDHALSWNILGCKQTDTVYSRGSQIGFYCEHVSLSGLKLRRQTQQHKRVPKETKSSL